MGQKLEPAELELYRRVDEVLHYIWDPIGIAGIPEARDEYDGYLAHVFSLLIQEEGEEEVRAYLLKTEVERMGLTTTEVSKAQLDRAVRAAFEWKKVIAERKKSGS